MPHSCHCLILVGCMCYWLTCFSLFCASSMWRSWHCIADVALLTSYCWRYIADVILLTFHCWRCIADVILLTFHCWRCIADVALLTLHCWRCIASFLKHCVSALISYVITMGSVLIPLVTGLILHIVRIRVRPLTEFGSSSASASLDRHNTWRGYTCWTTPCYGRPSGAMTWSYTI